AGAAAAAARAARGLAADQPGGHGVRLHPGVFVHSPGATVLHHGHGVRVIARTADVAVVSGHAGGRPFAVRVLRVRRLVCLALGRSVRARGCRRRARCWRRGRHLWQGAAAMTLGLSVSGLLVLLALGGHVGTAMGLMSSAMVMSVDGVPLTVVAQTAFKSINSYPLMAIPMFVLMGNLMMRGNIVALMIELIGSVVRCVRGGLALTVMLACVFFAAVSGSSVGSAAAIGAATVDGLKRENYPPRFSAALVAVGGTLGLMIPPSLGFILIGSIVGLPVDRLFVAGIVPGLMEAALLLMTTAWMTRRGGYGATTRSESTRLNSSHVKSSYAVFCLKQK